MNTENLQKTIPGGYIILQPSVIANLLAAQELGKIKFRAGRSFISLISMSAIRKASSKQRRKQHVRFELDEIHQRVGGVGGAYIKEDISALKKEGLLLNFYKTEIEINQSILPFAKEKLEIGNGNRQTDRSIPVPRRMLEELCKISKPSVFKGALDYLLRGMSLGRGGIIKRNGAVKASWLSAVAGIGLSTAKAVRKWMIEKGWLTKDTSSIQRKLNRTGAYFTLMPQGENHEEQSKAKLSNIEASPKPEISQIKEIAILPSPVPTTTHIELQNGCEFRLPPPKNGCEFRPPIKRQRPSNEVKDHELTEKQNFGSHSDKESGAYKKLPPPTFNEIVPEDLTQLARLEQLYHEAIQRKIIPISEIYKLNFISAAIRARELATMGKGDSVRLFAGIVRQGLWQVISQTQEDKARNWVLSEREHFGDFGRNLNIVERSWNVCRTKISKFVGQQNI